MAERWSDAENAELVRLYAEYIDHRRKWVVIAQILNSKYHDGSPVRNPTTIRKVAEYRLKHPNNIAPPIVETQEEKDERQLYLDKRTALLGRIDRIEKENRKLRLITNNIVEQISESIAVLKPSAKIFAPRPKAGKHKPEDANLIFSDAQIGERIELSETRGYSEYNINVFKDRIDLLKHSTVEIIELHSSLYSIKRLNIWMLGDNVDGDSIYRGHGNFIEMNVVDQVIEGVDEVSRMVRDLAGCGLVKEVCIYCIDGNHGRVSRDQMDTTANWDRIFYKFMKLQLRDIDNVNVHIPESWFDIQNVYSHGYFYTHGDAIKSWMRTPVYGIENAIKDWFALFGTYEPFKVLMIGHHHRPIFLPLNEFKMFINGCLPGGNIFSMKRLRQASVPTQWLFGCNETRATTWQYPLELVLSTDKSK